MKIKGLALFVLVLAILAGIVWWVSRPPTTPPATAATPNVALLDRETLAATARIEITQEDEDAPLVFVANEDGIWVMPDNYGAPIDFARLARLTRSLEDGEVLRFVTRNPERMERLDLEQTRLVFKDDTGKIIHSVNVGREGATAGRFVRIDDAPEAYLAELNLTVDPNPANWADKTVLPFTSDEVKSVMVSFPEGEPFAFSRETLEAEFTAADLSANRAVNNQEVLDMIRAITTGRFQAIVPAEDPNVQASREDPRRLVFTTFDNHTHTVFLGRGVPPEPPAPDPESETPPPPPSPAPLFLHYETTAPAAVWPDLFDAIGLRYPTWIADAMPTSPDDLLETVADETEAGEADPGETVGATAEPPVSAPTSSVSEEVEVTLPPPDDGG